MPPPPTPLPTNPFPPSAFFDAYKRCLDLEAKSSSLTASANSPSPVICARLLGHLLRLVPTVKGRNHLQREITAAADDTTLMQLARLYMVEFIFAFKRAGRSVGAPFAHPTSPSFENLRESLKQVVTLCRHRHNVRSPALERSKNRCMVTGQEGVNGGRRELDAAHIIPIALNQGLTKPNKLFHSAGTYAIFERFSDVSVVHSLAGRNIDNMDNIILMRKEVHSLYDNLLIWLRPVANSDNTYRACYSRELLRDPDIPVTVTFTTDTNMPLPNRSYIELHALCAEVACLSGLLSEE